MEKQVSLKKIGKNFNESWSKCNYRNVEKQLWKSYTYNTISFKVTPQYLGLDFFVCYKTIFLIVVIFLNLILNIFYAINVVNCKCINFLIVSIKIRKYI